eukprot:368401_1
MSQSRQSTIIRGRKSTSAYSTTPKTNITSRNSELNHKDTEQVELQEIKKQHTFKYEKFVPKSTIPNVQNESKRVSITVTNADEKVAMKQKQLKGIIVPITHHTTVLANTMSARLDSVNTSNNNTSISSSESKIEYLSSSDSYPTDEEEEKDNKFIKKINKNHNKYHKKLKAKRKSTNITKYRMDLDMGFRSNAEMYRYNYRPIIYVIVSILLLIIPSMMFDEYDDKRHEIPYLFYIYGGYTAINGIIILYCLIVAIFRQHKKSSIQKEHALHIQTKTQKAKDLQISEDVHIFDEIQKQHVKIDIKIDKPALHRAHSLDLNNKCYCLTRLIYSFSDEFNKIFDIRNDISRVQAKIAPPFSGCILVSSISSCSGLFALIAYKYGTGLWNLCPTSSNLDDIENGQCLMRKIQLMSIVTMSAMTVIVAFSLISQVSSECQQAKLLALGKILKVFEKQIFLKTLNQKINVRLDQLIYSLNLKSMKMYTLINIFVCLCAYLWHFYEFGYKQKYWIKCNKPNSKIFDIYGRCIVLFNSVFFLNALQRLMKQYKYILIVMKVFTKAIYCQHIDDIIAWWQLRRYYRGYEITTFSNVFNHIIAWLLFIAFIFVLYLLFIIFYFPHYTLTPDEYMFFAMVFYLIFAVLHMLGIAVKCHREQKYRHTMMLDREIIYIKRRNVLSNKHYNKQRDYIYKQEVDLILDIKNDIEEHSLPINILGLSMSETTIYIIRGYFGASMGALLLEWAVN